MGARGEAVTENGMSLQVTWRVGDHAVTYAGGVARLRLYPYRRDGVRSCKRTEPARELRIGDAAGA